MKTSVSQKIIIQNFLLKNAEWEVSNLENTYFSPSASFTPKFSQLWHPARVKHWEDVSWLLSLAKECFWGFFLFGWWWLLFCFCLFVLVWDIEISIIAKQAHLSSFILKEKKIQANWAGDVFLAEPLGVAAGRVMPLLGAGRFPGASSHPLGAVLALQRHQHCSSGWVWGDSPWQAAQFGWLRVFGGSASVGWVGLESAASSAMSCCSCPSAGTAGVTLWWLSQTPPWDLWG